MNRWTIFDGGIAQFRLAVLTGVVNPVGEADPGISVVHVLELAGDVITRRTRPIT
uniref:hypothetical protein n=1 Tax=Streptomyces chartreusis TaxID=1969 RepID=UPI003F49AD6C